SDTPAYYGARQYLVSLLAALGLDGQAKLVPIDVAEETVDTTYYQPGRSATVFMNDKVVGRIGEYKASVRRALKLPAYCAGFELGIKALLPQAHETQYTPLPKFPKVEQDITLQV